MKPHHLEALFKYFSFALATLSLVLIVYNLSQPDINLADILGYLGLFLVSIEMGVLMTYEQLSAKVSLQALFKKQTVILSPIGVFALTLGKIGTILIMIPILKDIIYIIVVF